MKSGFRPPLYYSKAVPLYTQKGSRSTYFHCPRQLPAEYFCTFWAMPRGGPLAPRSSVHPALSALSFFARSRAAARALSFTLHNTCQVSRVSQSLQQQKDSIVYVLY